MGTPIQNSCRYRVLMMLKICDISETGGPTLRQTESAKHHHTSIQSHGACACGHPDLSAVQQDLNGHKHAGEEQAYPDLEVAICRPVKRKNLAPGMERITSFKAGTPTAQVGYGSAR